MIPLDAQIKAKVMDFLPEFKNWLDTDEAKEDLKERGSREFELKNLLNVEAIVQLTELDFKRIIASLWAYAGWTNKDYVADRILQSTDLNTLRLRLRDLLYGSAPLPERYDKFSREVRGIGPAGITEILAFVDPTRYGIWNDKSRRGLEILGLGQRLPTKKYKISGAEYQEVIDVLKSIFNIIEPQKGEPDLIYVDFFLYYLATQMKEGGEEKEDYEFDHDEIVEKLVELGAGLGFEANSEQQIAKGSRVDVLWRARIANLGVVSYVFEVQKGGSIDSLILNLQRAKNNPTVQKLVVVANTRDLSRIRGEVESLSEDFRKSLAYMEARDVEKASDLLAELNSIISKLELVP